MGRNRESFINRSKKRENNGQLTFGVNKTWLENEDKSQSVDSPVTWEESKRASGGDEGVG